MIDHIRFDHNDDVLEFLKRDHAYAYVLILITDDALDEPQLKTTRRPKNQNEGQDCGDEKYQDNKRRIVSIFQRSGTRGFSRRLFVDLDHLRL
jgi:hypothetical protein